MGIYKIGDRWQEYFETIDHLICCPIIDRIDDQERVTGTAIHVMPGVFLTAKHVVEDWHNRSNGVERGLDIDSMRPEDAGEFTIKVLQLMKGGIVASWQPEKIMTLPGYDVAILIDDQNFNEHAQALLNEGAYPHIGFDLHQPRIGAQVIAKGYPNTISKPNPSAQSFTHLASMKTSLGVVEEVYYKAAGLVKSPCFQSNLEVEGGMSGGPVFNADNSLIIGLVSSSYPPAGDYEQFTTLSPFLWQALIAEIQIGFINKEPVTLLDLAKQGYLYVEGLDHLEKINDQWIWNEYSETCNSCN